MIRKTVLVTLVATLTIAPISALASRPVKKTVSACVQGGELIADGYTYRVRSSAASADTDLAPYEGRRIRVKGYLLPGDVLIGDTIEVVPGACPAKQ